MIARTWDELAAILESQPKRELSDPTYRAALVLEEEADSVRAQTLAKELEEK